VSKHIFQYSKIEGILGFRALFEFYQVLYWKQLNNSGSTNAKKVSSVPAGDRAQATALGETVLMFNLLNFTHIPESCYIRLFVQQHMNLF